MPVNIYKSDCNYVSDTCSNCGKNHRLVGLGQTPDGGLHYVCNVGGQPGVVVDATLVDGALPADVIAAIQAGGLVS